MIKQFFNERVKYHTTNPLLGIVGGIKLARQMAIYECMEKFGKEDTIAALETFEYKADPNYPSVGGVVVDEKSGITGDYVGVQTDDREFKLVPVKRNKQVDVPTEAWQKNVERNLAYANNTIVPLIAYLSRHHGLDISKFNEWKQEYLDAIK